MKFALTPCLSLLIVLNLCAASANTDQEEKNITEPVKLLEDGYVRIWTDLLKKTYKSEMTCELAKRSTWSHGVEKYLEEFKADIEFEVTDLMNDLLKESCEGFRMYVVKELSAMLEA